MPLCGTSRQRKRTKKIKYPSQRAHYVARPRGLANQRNHLLGLHKATARKSTQYLTSLTGTLGLERVLNNKTRDSFWYAANARQSHLDTSGLWSFISNFWAMASEAVNRLTMNKSDQSSQSRQAGGHSKRGPKGTYKDKGCEGKPSRNSHQGTAIINDCKWCGSSHPKGKCPAYGKTCSNCGKTNHFVKACRKKENFDSL